MIRRPMLSVLGLLVALAHVVVLMLALLGLVFLAPLPLRMGRWVVTRRRLLAELPLPYQPAPLSPQPEVDGMYRYGNSLYRTPKYAFSVARFNWLLDDRATWRDLLFLVLDPIPLVVAVAGLFFLPWGALGLLALPFHDRWGRLLLTPPKRREPLRLHDRVESWSHCIAYFGLSLLGLGVAVLMPFAPKIGRALTNLRRDLAGQWNGVSIERPYVRGPVFRDRATWRDWLFLVADPIVGTVLTVVPVALVIYAGWGLVMPLPLQLMTDENWGNGWYGQFAGSETLAAVMSLVLTGLAGLISPVCVRAASRWARVLLSPTEKSRLALRVEELTATRADATHVQASELRRIERDLHDGAQARLVAMGLGLGAVEQLIDADPDAAKTMLAKVQDNSARALIELRDLVRGIHPPVLAERGLGDAVRALALDTPLPVRVHVDLPYRLEPPVESAAYFAISEALGAAQRATEATIDIQLQHDTLQLTVSHDGHVTEGLHGIERRLGAFDGTLTAHSPKGGPTTLRMTIQVSAG